MSTYTHKIEAIGWIDTSTNSRKKLVEVQKSLLLNFNFMSSLNYLFDNHFVLSRIYSIDLKVQGNAVPNKRRSLNKLFCLM